ncbi:hypothetical protein [Magnetovibrio sp.]|uniref:hypothetical protein n=1 Tax=Magnetovibrio sp. TaxID=2024836 RepID=UPI002F958DE7
MITASSSIDRLIERTAAGVFGPAELAAIVSNGDWLVFFPGEVGKRPETADLAVILPELVKGRNGSLQIAVVNAEDEEALSAEYGVLVKPTVAFVRDGDIKGLVPRIKDWAEYEFKLAELLPVDTNRSADA